MHGTAVLAAASLLSVASPARAEFPAAVSAWVGVGLGSGDREEVAASGTFGLAGLEAAWRFRRGRALVATYESSGGPGSTMSPSRSAPSSPSHRDPVSRSSVAAQSALDA